MFAEGLLFLGWAYWSFEDWAKETINAYLTPIILIASIQFIQTKLFLISLLFYLPAIAFTFTSYFKKGDTLIMMALLFTSQAVQPVASLFHTILILSVILLLQRTKYLNKEKLWFAPVAAIAHITPYIL